MNEIKVIFSQGTLIVQNGDENSLSQVARYVTYDPRVKSYRAQGYHYAPIVLTLHRSRTPYQDLAKDFSPIELEISNGHSPRHYQTEALTAWKNAGRRGVVVLPTGAGKSYMAMMAMKATQRPTLIVTPTIDLTQQWASNLERALNRPIGMLGGGEKNIQDVTVSTYDSAVIHMEYIGNKFGMVVFDECHHLPGKVNRTAAQMCVAPFRLGLTATPERDEDEDVLYDLIGPLVYRIDIDELEGDALSIYDVIDVPVYLDEDEMLEYTTKRQIYTDFLRNNGITFSKRSDWGRFVALCARLPGGREVFHAYLAQKRIARSGRAKVRKIWELIKAHNGERTIVFTAENDSAYQLGNALLAPVVTHKTKTPERKLYLEKFRSGEWPILVTSKVLNEGVDVPEASVGIIVSGSGSVREHVQRLGRILRPVKGKRATLYELVSEGTSETRVSERRRQHRAYQRSY